MPNIFQPTNSQDRKALSAKQQLKQTASIADELLKNGLKPLSSALLLSLACRGLLPEGLCGTPAAWLLERLSRDFFAVETMQIDSSDLANCLISPEKLAEERLIDHALLQKSNFAESERALISFQSLAQTFSQISRRIIADPLFCGWLYQTILMARIDYTHSREQKTTDRLAQISQWFTPAWICDFLLDECFHNPASLKESDKIALHDCYSTCDNGTRRHRTNQFSHDSKTVTFLDSACGAGHILAPALLKLLAQRLAGRSTPLETVDVKNLPETQLSATTLRAAEDISIIESCDSQTIAQNLSEILTTQLYGLDTDPLMVSLSGLTVYLRCRDLSKTAPLPIPLLFSFQPVNDKLQLPFPGVTKSVSARRRSSSKNSEAPPASPAGDSQSSEQPIDHELFADELETAEIGDDQNRLSDAAQGSLLLSLSPRPNHVLLRRIDGTTATLASLPKSFDLQTLNPPYLSHRLMPGASSRFLRTHYDGSQYDLYTAFLELSIRLMAPGGTLAMICQQSFLTTSRFEYLRRQLIERCHINSIVQLGAGTFASRGGEKVSNAMISLSKKSEKDQHQVSVYKLVTRSAKKKAEEDGVHELIKQTFDENELLKTTRMIPGYPLVPFCPDEVAFLFQTHQTISQSNNGITLTNGLFTCDNKRFVRHFSELSKDDLCNFVPYDKGGGQKWFSTTPYMLEWKNDGDDIRQFRHQRGQSKALPGERFYFRRGITYSYIGTKGFKARLLSHGSVFDIASSAMFSERIDLFYLLGFLNSSLTRFILGMLNPTVNFQIGDLRRVPFCPPPRSTENEVARLAQEAVSLAREAESFDRSSPAYDPIRTGSLARSQVALINQTELQLQDKIDKEIFELYKISSTTRDIIRENEWVTRTRGNLLQMPGSPSL